MESVKNPWVGVENYTAKYGREFVLKIDEADVNKVRSRQKNPLLQLRLHVPPEPWCGPIESASVLVLSGNPRWNAADEGMPELAHQLMIENLTGTRPMIWLDPEVEAVSGSNWYRTRLLNRVIEIVPQEKVARNLCQVDFYGYRSEKWDSSLRFPSQAYTFDRIRSAMKRRAVVVVTMAWKQWMEVIPELGSYPKAFRNSSWENKTLSETNTKYSALKEPAQGFASVIEALENSTN